MIAGAGGIIYAGGGAFLAEEAAAFYFEYFTGYELIINPVDVAQKGTKWGAKKFASEFGNGIIQPRRNPIHGLPRVGSATKLDRDHAFPDLVDNFAGDAVQYTLQKLGPQGVVTGQVELYQLEGSLRRDPKNGAFFQSVDGVFEWIVDQNTVTHRRFVPRGSANGTPNQY